MMSHCSINIVNYVVSKDVISSYTEPQRKQYLESFVSPLSLIVVDVMLWRAEEGRQFRWVGGIHPTPLPQRSKKTSNNPLGNL